MKVIPVSSPHAMAHTQTTTNNTSSRAKAIEMLTGTPAKAQANTTPVGNPNQVQVEELGAIQATESTDNSTDTVDNEDTSTTEESTEDTTLEAKSTTEKPPVEVKDTPTSRQMAQLARHERALRAKAQAQEQAFKAREDALKAKEAELTAKDNQYKQGYISRDRLKSDTLAALAEAEVSYDDVTQQILNQQPANPKIEAHIGRLEAKIKQLEEANEATQKSFEQRQQESYKTAIKQIESDVKNLVKADPSTYEAIAKTGSIKDVVELIEQTYAKDNILLSVEEAAQEVEDYLVEEGVNTISRIDKIKKRIAQSNASNAKSEVKTPATQKQTQTPMKTLTNAASSTRQLSAKERAILAFKGQLKD